MEKKKNKPGTSYMPRICGDKATDFTDKPVVNCDAPRVKYNSLDNDFNNDCK